MSKFAAIYVRRSVNDEKKDNKSLSIEAQKGACINYLKNRGITEYEIYCDNGISGKDTEHRPDFQRMMTDIREGVVNIVVFKKLDRLSRSTKDFYIFADELENRGIDYCSVDDNIDTSTFTGRAMQGLIAIFAQLERETIAERVKSAYSVRATTTGFYQGGKILYGYKSERRFINGKMGSVLVPSPQAEVVKKAFELYQKENMSLCKVIGQLRESGLYTETEDNGKNGKPMDERMLTKMLSRPQYVKANADVYRYFAAKGYEMLDDIEAYDGNHGLFIHGHTQKKDEQSKKIFVKVADHEGLIEPSVWLAVQDRKAHNKKVPARNAARCSWLTGLTKCAHCGYAIVIQYAHNPNNRYYRDMGARNTAGCLKNTLKIRPDEVEEIVLFQMREHLKKYEIARIEKKTHNAETTALISVIEKCNAEIEGLLDKFALTDNETAKLILNRIKRISDEKSEAEQKLYAYERRNRYIDTAPLSEPLARWNELTTEEKNTVAKEMINVIKISDETGINIEFSF